MDTAVAQRIALIAFETELADWGMPEEGGADYYPHTSKRPLGVRLDNDGCIEYWIHSSWDVYYLAFDGTGWRVTADRRLQGHIYRLAEASAPKDTFIDWLPAEDGTRVVLERGQEYRLKLEYIEDLSHPPQRARMALTLCLKE